MVYKRIFIEFFAYELVSIQFSLFENRNNNYYSQTVVSKNTGRIETTTTTEEGIKVQFQN